MPQVRPRVRLAPTLPAMLAEDPFIGRFAAGLDDVLAPLQATLDCLDRYVDPMLTPEDFLGWLAGWVGLDLDPSWPVGVRRALLASGAEVQDARGTVEGLRQEIALLTGCAVEVCEPGGVVASAEIGGSLPRLVAGRGAGARAGARGVGGAGTGGVGGAVGGRSGGVVVRVLGAPVDLADPASESHARLVRAVRAAVPAHLPVTVEVSS